MMSLPAGATLRPVLHTPTTRHADQAQGKTVKSSNASPPPDPQDRDRGKPSKPSLRRQLQIWYDKARWRFAAGGERISADITTLPRPGRGQALRDAHRTLSQRMHSHPAIRRVMPHLSCVERALAKHGSRALRKLPVPVLQRSLVQLALLQRDDEPPLEAADLRVLRLRLMEAIALRSAAGVRHNAGIDSSHLTLPSGFTSSSGSPSGYDGASSGGLGSVSPHDDPSTDGPTASEFAAGDPSSGGLTLDRDDDPSPDYDYRPEPRRISRG